MIENVITTNLTAHMLLTHLLIGTMKDRETALRDETYANPIRIGAVFQGGTNTRMFEKADEVMRLEKYTEPEDLADIIVFMLTRPKKLWLNEVQITYSVACFS